MNIIRVRKKSSKEEPKQDSNKVIIENLKTVYREKLLPLEEASLFHEFYSTKLEDPDFDAKPMILFVGQYSTGKTSFIRYLLGREYTGMRIGPEPTTDKFVAVMYGPNDAVIPGNALVVDPTKQFRSLTKFGTSFLNRFQCSLCNAPILEKITLVDTPGVLSGEKQRVDRAYDFPGVLEWFAEHSDRIILLFDANKLDISDEMRRSIRAIKGHEEKLKIVLNKSDLVDFQELLRVYGALMWYLGKVIESPEVARVYLGSFWERPLLHDTNRQFFEKEELDLLQDIESLPKNQTVRKLNDLIKRSRQVRIHALLFDAIKKRIPKGAIRRGNEFALADKLEREFQRVQMTHLLHEADLPDAAKMAEKLVEIHPSLIKKIRPQLLNALVSLENEDLPNIWDSMAQLVNSEAPPYPRLSTVPEIRSATSLSSQEYGLSSLRSSQRTSSESLVRLQSTTTPAHNYPQVTPKQPVLTSQVLTPGRSDRISSIPTSLHSAVKPQSQLLQETIASGTIEKIVTGHSSTHSQTTPLSSRLQETTASGTFEKAVTGHSSLHSAAKPPSLRPKETTPGRLESSATDHRSVQSATKHFPPRLQDTTASGALEKTVTGHSSLHSATKPPSLHPQETVAGTLESPATDHSSHRAQKSTTKASFNVSINPDSLPASLQEADTKKDVQETKKIRRRGFRKSKMKTKDKSETSQVESSVTDISETSSTQTKDRHV